MFFCELIHDIFIKKDGTERTWAVFLAQIVSSVIGSVVTVLLLFKK